MFEGIGGGVVVVVEIRGQGQNLGGDEEISLYMQGQVRVRGSQWHQLKFVVVVVVGGGVISYIIFISSWTPPHHHHPTPPLFLLVLAGSS